MAGPTCSRNDVAGASTAASAAMRAAISELSSRPHRATDSAVIAAMVSRTGFSEGASGMVILSIRRGDEQGSAPLNLQPQTVEGRVVLVTDGPARRWRLVRFGAACGGSR